MMCILLVVVATIVVAQDASKDNGKSTDLSVYQAQVLLYLSPAAKAVREAGFDVGMEAQTSSAYNQADYFVFYMYNSKRQCDSCSVTVGYFAVNKHTGDVRDLDAGEDAPLVNNEELAGVQRIMRVEHRITPATVQQYRTRPVESQKRH